MENISPDHAKRTRKLNLRAGMTLLVLFLAIVLLVGGAVLFVAHSGRIARETGWAFFGLSKQEWGDLHLTIGFIFVVAIIIHLAFNWRALKHYLGERVKQGIRPSREFFLSFIVFLAILTAVLMQLPPVNIILDLHRDAKFIWKDGAGPGPSGR